MEERLPAVVDKWRNSITIPVVETVVMMVMAVICRAELNHSSQHLPGVPSRQKTRVRLISSCGQRVRAKMDLLRAARRRINHPKLNRRRVMVENLGEPKNRRRQVRSVSPGPVQDLVGLEHVEVRLIIISSNPALPAPNITSIRRGR